MRLKYSQHSYSLLIGKNFKFDFSVLHVSQATRYTRTYRYCPATGIMYAFGPQAFVPKKHITKRFRVLHYLFLCFLRTFVARSYLNYQMHYGLFLSTLLIARLLCFFH